MNTIRFCSALLLLLCLHISTISNAQVTATAGGMIGAAAASFEHESIRGYPTSRWGFYMAANVEVQFFNRLSLYSELSYIQKGNQLSVDVFDLDFSTTNRINYIEVPIFLKYDFLPDPGEDFQVYIGPTFGFFQSFKTETTGLGEGLNPENSVIESGILESDKGIAFGSTIRKEAGPGMVVLDLRVSAGLSPALVNSDGQEYSNKYILFSAGYVLYLNKMGGSRQ